MATQIIMPKQGLQMTEGTITQWLAKEGDAIEKGKPLFEMETDKQTMTIDSPVSGILAKILRWELDTVPVAEPIALVAEPQESIGLAASAPQARTTLESPPAQIAAPLPAPDAAAAAQPWAPQPAAPAAARPVEPDEARVFVTPRAKTVAAGLGVDYSSIPGSGPDGLVIERDALTAALKAQAAAAGQETQLPAAPRETAVEVTAMRRAIWGNMMASVHGMAQARHRVQVDMAQAVALRRAFKDAGQAVSFNDILIRALCRALLEHPELNAAVADGRIIQKHYVHMGLAVALDKGLVVPTIRDAHAMTLAQLHAAAEALVDKARRGVLTPDDYAGGTFTLTNLGMYGIDEFDAIVNPPQAAILAVGRIADTPVAREGQVVVRPMAKLTLTYDHRIVDGAPAARFLQRLAALLENPVLLL